MDAAMRERLVEKAAEAFYLEDVQSAPYDWLAADEGVREWYRRMTTTVVDALGVERWGTYLDPAYYKDYSDHHTMTTACGDGAIPLFRLRAAEPVS